MNANEWLKHMRQTLESRQSIAPDDLPPFGSLIQTSTGHTAEVVGWFASNPKERTSYANLRVCFALIVDGAAPGADGSKMLLASFSENQVLSGQPQKMPRFGRWLINAMLTGEDRQGA